jgi:hypothetical protein
MPASSYQAEWVRFDSIKITKSRVHKRRTLLVNGVHGIIHIFKTSTLTNGALVTNDSCIHKVIRVAEEGLVIERDPHDRRRLRWYVSGANSTGSEYVFRSKQERERFASIGTFSCTLIRVPPSSLPCIGSMLSIE